MCFIPMIELLFSFQVYINGANFLLYTLNLTIKITVELYC